MLKTILYYTMAATAVLRLADMIYVLTSGGTSLPMAAFFITGFMLVYAGVLIVKRFSGTIRLRQLMIFYGIHAVAIAANLIIVSVNIPLAISTAEMVITGSFLDIIVDICAVYFCIKQMRSSYKSFDDSVGKGLA